MHWKQRTPIVLMVAWGLILWLLPTVVQAQVKRELDPALKPYERNGSKLAGTIMAGSSDTVKRLMDLWTEGFQYHHPKVKIETQVIKASEAPGAIIAGELPIIEGSKLTAISYPLSEAQLQRIKARMGVQPIQIPVALDAIVLVVHYRNPLAGLTLEQVKKIFAKPADKESRIVSWQEAGLNSKLGSMEINRYGRDDTSGTHAAFKAMALNGAAQHVDVHPQPGSMSVVIEVGSDEAGIGYAATGYARKSSKVRVVPLAKREGEPFVRPTNESVESGEYPLRRELYLYAMPEQDGTLNPTIKEFVTFVLRRDGQQFAKEDGFSPLPAQLAEQSLRKLEGNGPVTSVPVGTTK